MFKAALRFIFRKICLLFIFIAIGTNELKKGQHKSVYPGAGALPYKPMQDVPFPRVSFQAQIPEQDTKIDQKFRNRVLKCRDS